MWLSDFLFRLIPFLEEFQHLLIVECVAPRADRSQELMIRAQKFQRKIDLRSDLTINTQVLHAVIIESAME